MSGLEHECRFVVCDPAGLGSVQWLVWVNEGKPDVYVAANFVLSHMKASIHQSGERHEGFSSHYPNQRRIKNRHMEKWLEGVQIGAGFSLDHRPVVPASELRAHVADDDQLTQHWIPAAEPRRQVSIHMLFGKYMLSGGRWPGHSTLGSRRVWFHIQSSGTMLWLVSKREDVPDPEYMESLRQTLRQGVARGPLKETLFGPTPGILVVANCDDGVRSQVDVAADSLN